jgi:hypothetical protein
VRVNSPAREDISWWSQCLVDFTGLCHYACDVVLPSYCFSTDACLTGGGAHLMHDWCYFDWLVDFLHYAHAHINVIEMLTALLLIKRWGPCLWGTHFMVRTDNMTTLATLIKGSSRSRKLMPLVREVFWLNVRFCS